MTLQEQHDEKRRLYLDGTLSHQDFYLWLAQAIKVNECQIPVSLASLAGSTKPYFNDIAALRVWDNMDPTIRRQAHEHGMRSWSLSDTVCALKAAARAAVIKLQEAKTS
jgi:hypothetical protein